MNSMPFRQLKSFLKILIGVQYEKREIHTVFLRFPNVELSQKSRLGLLAKLCGVALYFSGSNFITDPFPLMAWVQNIHGSFNPCPP